MNDFSDIAKDILQQTPLEKGFSSKMAVDDVFTILLELSSVGEFQILSLLRSGIPDSPAILELEGLLKTSYDNRLSTNLVGSITADGDYSCAKPYYDGFQSAGLLESDLMIMHGAITQIAGERGANGRVDDGEVNNYWMQV